MQPCLSVYKELWKDAVSRSYTRVRAQRVRPHTNPPPSTLDLFVSSWTIATFHLTLLTMKSEDSPPHSGTPC